MKMPMRIGTGLIAAALPVLALPASPAADREAGHAEYETCHFDTALRAFTRAAEAGDLRAQEIVGFMYLYGPRLYGPTVAADPVAARHWFARAAAQGSEVGARFAATPRHGGEDQAALRASP